MISIIQRFGLVLFCLILFCLLIFKNPFSQRNLLDNLEPYPDTIYYINPALSLINGFGLNVEREGRILKPNVPPFYSLVLTPSFLIKPDARMFYLSNIILSLVSLFLFYKILLRLTANKFIISLSLFFYVTNYFIYWYPDLAMAENLILPLFLAAGLLLIEKVSFKKTLLASFITTGFYATKYAAAPLLLIFFALYLGKILSSKIDAAKKFFYLKIFILISLLIFGLFSLFQYLNGENTALSSLFDIVLGIKSQGSSSSAAVQTWFSLNYFSRNLTIYLGSLIGQPAQFLWNYSKMVESYLGILGLLGLVSGLFIKKYRFVSLSLLLLLGGSILFLSTFYTQDNRYIYFAIPVILIGLSIQLILLLEFFSTKHLKFLAYVFMALLLAIYLVSNALPIKNQIMLNLKHSETPWYYVSVLNLNNYFSKAQSRVSQPIVISSMPSYYIDFFSNRNYQLLPLSKDQEFRSHLEQSWGVAQDSDLINLYENYLKQGREVYLSEYGLGNAGYLHEAFNEVLNKFNSQQIYSGCYNLCNLYKLSLKSN